jgi:hypothetical protein
MVFRKRNPPSAANAMTAVTVAPANGALPKNRGLSSGSVRRSSYGTNTARATAASPNRPAISGEPQPLEGPSMIA